jgi:hypothetical protein
VEATNVPGKVSGVFALVAEGVRKECGKIGARMGAVARESAQSWSLPEVATQLWDALLGRFIGPGAKRS